MAGAYDAAVELPHLTLYARRLAAPLPQGVGRALTLQPRLQLVAALLALPALALLMKLSLAPLEG
jgi:hypothetical protein